jgi:hypothetical protein
LSSERRKVEDTYTGGPTWTSPAERVAVQRRTVERETFGEYGTRWIAERRNAQGQPLRALTRKDYEQLLADYLAPTFGAMAVEDITRTAVRHWHDALDKTKPRAATKAYGLLRAIMNSAVDDEIIAISPVTSGAPARRPSGAPWSPRRHPS